MQFKVLVVDDEANIRNSLTSLITDEGYNCIAATNGQEALEVMRSETIDLIITDLMMPEVDGLQLLEAVRQEFQDIRVIILTAYGTVESAVQAIKYGAVDFLLKPVDFDMLLVKVQECFRDVGMRRELAWFKKKCQDGTCGNCLTIVGESPAWKELLKKAEKLSKSDLTVLITGESGTGKEVLARLMHRWSDRVDEPFVPVNCGGLPETLLESELFGVVKGAFSGAVKDRQGLIRTARGGTLFLDEISELSLGSQAKLLRVLQDGEVRPLGSDKAETASCRFIAATNLNLQEAVRNGSFREDLYYRISSYTLHIPPLRERWEDVPLLAAQFIYCNSNRSSRQSPLLTAEAVSVLQSYDWPGNVRQLENVIKGALLFSDGNFLSASDFPPEIFDTGLKHQRAGLKGVLDRFERAYLTRVLRDYEGDKKAAADELQISLTTLYQKLKDLNIPAHNIS